MKKTNALRILDSANIVYKTKEYTFDEEHLGGEHVLSQVNLSKDQVYKTLVLKGNKDYLVCCIPVLEEIDLKKLAKVSDNKAVEMIPMKDLLNVTGYIRGGCSPVGMKKKFDTYIQEDIILEEEIAVSAGVRGLQVILKSDDLLSITEGKLCDVIRRSK